MLHLWRCLNISLLIQFILLVYPCKCSKNNSLPYINRTCINMPSFVDISKYLKTICNFLHANNANKNGILFVSVNLRIAQPTEYLMRIMQKHCCIVMMNLEINQLLDIPGHIIKYIGGMILDIPICEMCHRNPRMCKAIRSIQLRVLEIRGGNTVNNKKTGVDSTRKISDILSICEANKEQCIDFRDHASDTETVTVEVRKFEPFTIADNGTTFRSGIEIMLVALICEKLNIQPIYIASNSSPNERLDTIMIGGWPVSLQQSQTLKRSSTVVYDFDSTVWCVRHSDLVPTWQNIFKIFKSNRLEIICLFGIIFYTVTALYYAFTYIEDLDWDAYRIMLQVLQNSLNMTTNIRLKKTSTQCIYFLLLYSSLLFYIYLLSFYINVIKKEFYRQQIHSWHSFEEEGIDLAIDEQRVNSYFIEEFPPELKKRLIKCPDINNCLGYLVNNPQLAVATSKKYALNNPTVSSRDIYCFEDPEHFSVYAVSMYIPLNYPLETSINKHIHWIHQGGFINKWLSNSKTTYKSQKNHQFGPVVLTVEHLFLAFFIYFLSFLCACGALIAEHIVYKMICQAKPAHIWLIADMLLRGHRYFLLPPSGQKRKANQMNQIT